MQRNNRQPPSRGQKISAILLGIAFWLVFLSGGCARQEIANLDSQGEEIICFGDSITAGYGVNRGEDYPAQLQKLTSTKVLNAGNSGETSSDALKRLQSDVLDKKPFLVVVEFGGNDFLKKVPLEQTIKNMEIMVKRITSSGSIVAIADLSNNIIMSSYHREFKRLSKKYKTIFIPRLLRGILTTPSLKSDFIHPNAEGYKMISRRIFTAISAYLNQEKGNK